MVRRWVFPEGDFCGDARLLSGPWGQESLEPRVARLLVWFLRQPGEVLSHDQLLASV